jgi:hypothetical protein
MSLAQTDLRSDIEEAVIAAFLITSWHYLTQADAAADEHPARTATRRRKIKICNIRGFRELPAAA